METIQQVLQGIKNPEKRECLELLCSKTILLPNEVVDYAWTEKNDTVLYVSTSIGEEVQPLTMLKL